MKFVLVSIAAVTMVAGLALSQELRERQDLSNLPPIVRKSFEALKTARYSGERTVRVKRGPERLAYVEYILREGVRSRTEFPGDSPYKGQIIVDDGARRYHYFPDRNEIHVEPPRRQHMRFMMLGGNRDHSKRQPLKHVVADGGMVAGQKTQLVTVIDPNGNAIQKMWIEPRSGVTLKRILYDPVGGERGYFEFNKIRFNPSFAPGDFKIERKGAVVITPAMEARRYALELGLTPLMLPPSAGFQLEGAHVMNRRNGENILAQMYTGKEGRFTLFQVRTAVDPKRLDEMSRGRLSTYSWKRGQEGFALLGDLSEQRLREIARILGDR